LTAKQCIRLSKPRSVPTSGFPAVSVEATGEGVAVISVEAERKKSIILALGG
jgi:hypothetical protein